MRRLAVVLLVGAALVTTGCLDIEESLTLNRNLSGQAGFSMTIDMEPAVAFAAQMQRQMAGKKGPPTPQELAAVRADMLKQASASKPKDLAKDKQDMEQHLPRGVKLLDFAFKQDGLKTTTRALFGFRDLAALHQIVLDQPSAQAAGSGSQSPGSHPFEDLEVKDEGRTILITSRVTNPINSAKSQVSSQAPMNEAMQKQFNAMFKGLRIAVRITAPFAIVEQNATRHEGNSLIWEFDTSKLEKMTPAQLAQGIRVRYRK